MVENTLMLGLVDLRTLPIHTLGYSSVSVMEDTLMLGLGELRTLPINYPYIP